MKEIIYTKTNKIKVSAVYLEEERTFSIILNYNGKPHRVEDVQKLSNLIETFDYWCKYIGISCTPFSSCQVKKNLTTAKLRAD